MGVFGDTLRQARAHKGVTLREAEVATRINRHWLLALEEEHFDQLPALIYQRGIVRNYATYLSLDPAKLLHLFVEARGDRPTEEPTVLSQPTTIAPAGSFVPNFAVIAFVVVAMGAMFAWGYSAYFAGNEPQGNLPGAVATATQLNDEERFIASSTPVPPTATAIPPTSEPTQDGSSSGSGAGVTISYPTPSTTAEVITLDEGEADEDSANATEDDDSASGERSFNFYAVNDVELLIVVDNVIVWQSTLPATSVTGYFTGESFVVSVDDPSSLVYIDGEGGETFAEASDFTLP
jgi:cytoskeletal protein RodZ